MIKLKIKLADKNLQDKFYCSLFHHLIGKPKEVVMIGRILIPLFQLTILSYQIEIGTQPCHVPQNNLQENILFNTKTSKPNHY